MGIDASNVTVETTTTAPDTAPDRRLTMGIDASNVTVETTTTDPDTGELVRTVDGVEVERVAQPEVANEQTIRRGFDAMLTRADQIKSQMAAIDAASITTVAQAQTAIKTEARAIDDLTTGLRRLIRLIDRRLDGSD